jgi:hypothetical protein
MFETIAITGFVSFVVIAGGTNLLEDYKVPDFATVLIWSEDLAKFGTPETRLPGQQVCATGVI